jgi:hypothetical protein
MVKESQVPGIPADPPSESIIPEEIRLSPGFPPIPVDRIIKPVRVISQTGGIAASTSPVCSPPVVLPAPLLKC